VESIIFKLVSKKELSTRKVWVWDENLGNDILLTFQEISGLNMNFTCNLMLYQILMLKFDMQETLRQNYKTRLTDDKKCRDILVSHTDIYEIANSLFVLFKEIKTFWDKPASWENSFQNSSHTLTF